MNDLRTAAQQALEALEAIDEDPHGTHSFPALSNDAITALRTALAQQEPVALCDPAEYDDFQGAVSRNCASANSPKRHAPVTMETVYETIIHWDEGGGKRSRRELARRIVDLYTTPPRREWQGLTEKEREEATGWSVEHIEAALKERNT
jgi:hypothetical protein